MPAPHPALVSLARTGSLPPNQRITAQLAVSAAEHGMAPLVDHSVRIDGLDGDRDALTLLAMHSLESAAAMDASLAALREVVEVADSMNIDLAVFKGLGISLRWYERPEHRPAVDVDVFVNPAHRHRLGFLIEELSPAPGRRGVVDAMVAEGRVFEYSLDVMGVPIDVHLDPMNLSIATRRADVMWGHTEEFAFSEDRSIRTLDLELSLIQALIHLFHDNFADLLHVKDVALMLNAGPDWDVIAAFAEVEGWTDLVRSSLGYVCDVLDRPSPLPRSVTTANRLLISTVWPDRIRLVGYDSLARSARRQSLTGYLVTGRRCEVTAAMRRRLFPPRQVIDDRYPGCTCSYPVALARWRLAQHRDIRDSRSLRGAGHAAV